MGLTWQSSGLDSMLPLQGSWVPSLVGELRSHMYRGAAKRTINLNLKRKTICGNKTGEREKAGNQANLGPGGVGRTFV